MARDGSRGKAQFRDQESFFLIHVETQASKQEAFAKRMFRYFARLHEQYDVPVYLWLTAAEVTVYNRELNAISPTERERVMKAVDEWEERGIKRGLKEGKLLGQRAGKADLVVSLLRGKFGTAPKSLASRVRQLSPRKLHSFADALLDFSQLSDAELWMQQTSSRH